MCKVLVILVLMFATYQASGRGVPEVDRVPEAFPLEAGPARRTYVLTASQEALGSNLGPGTWQKRENKLSDRYLQSQDHKYISVTSTGAVVGKDKCDNSDRFTYELLPDKTSHLLNTRRGRYLAIDSSGKLYTSNGLTADTDLALERAGIKPRHFRIYRMGGNGGKLYLSISKQNQKVSQNEADIFHMKTVCN